jgi:hypothetical protein
VNKPLFRIKDPAKRCYSPRFIKTPSGYLFMLDMKERGSIDHSGTPTVDGYDESVFILSNTIDGLQDHCGKNYLIEVSWRMKNCHWLHNWREGTLYLLVCPLDKWMREARWHQMKASK